MRSTSLSTKFSITIALLVTVSVGVMSILAVASTRRSIREQVLSANLTAATLAARGVQQYLAAAAAIMREAAGRPKLSQEIQSANWPEAARVLENFLRNFAQFDYVFVQDARGVIRVRVPHADTVGQDFSFRDFFQEATRTRRLTISGVYVSRAAQRPVVAIAVPVFHDDAISGILVGALSLSALGQFVATIGADDGSQVYVVDRHGVLMAHSGTLAAGKPGTLATLPIVRAVMAGKSGTMEFQEPSGEEKFLGAHVPVALAGWGVVAAKPVRIAYTAADRLGRWLLWLGLGCAAAAAFLGWGFGRTLTGPLLRVVAATERLAAGDFSVRVSPKSRDEVAVLATSFNHMAAQLQSSYHDLERKTEEVRATNEDLAAEIVERRRAEEEVRRLNDELEQRVLERTRQVDAVNKELEAFTYTVSHDLKAPLRGMEGFARAIGEDYADRLDDTGRRYLGMVQTSARRMGKLIDDLLRYSRLERRQVRRVPISLRPLLEEVSGAWEAELQARGLEVRLDLAAESVEGEREGLREALTNLLGNAVKFSREGGGTIAVHAVREGATVVLAITDQGIGFDMKYHDRIFRIFERLHREEDYPGTGVGLAIVRKVAERHGGRAWAESEPGKGSTFYLALPIEEAV